MELFGLDLFSIALVWGGMYLAIKYGVKNALVEFEAGKEHLIEHRRQYDLLQDLAAKLSSYSMPGALPKSMTKDERKAFRKHANKISTKWAFSNMTNDDAVAFNKEALILMEQVTIAKDVEPEPAV